MKWSRLVLLFCLGAALAVAACGDDDDSSSSGNAPAEKPAAEKAAVEAPPTTPPAEIQVSEPLTEAPPKGKEVIFLQCELPACSRYAGGAKEASRALGWETKFQVFKN